MNKAFVREPELDGKAYCPRCGTLGIAVGQATLDHQIQHDCRAKLGDSAYFCGFGRCDVAYFDDFERLVFVSELRQAIYPKDLDAAICPCFGFSSAEIDHAIEQKSPQPIREMLAKSKSRQANCVTHSPSGRCCMQEIQRLYIRGVSGSG